MGYGHIPPNCSPVKELDTHILAEYIKELDIYGRLTVVKRFFTDVSFLSMMAPELSRLSKTSNKPSGC
jgi:hypothetical protein